MSDSHFTVKSFFLIPAETRCVCETLCTPPSYIWPLNLTFDIDGWPWPFTTQNVQLHEVHMHARYQVAIFNIAKFDLWPWPLTLKDDFDLDLSPLKMCSSMRYTCMPNIKLLSSILQNLTFDLELWPWRMTLTLTFKHSKCAAPWDTHACQISSCYL